MTSETLWMPENTSLIFWVSVIACFGFWLIAYTQIIKRGFADKTYGMPLAALACNFAWEALFSNIYPSPYLLIRIGNSLWLVFDILILVTVIKYAKNDLQHPLAKKFCVLAVLVGIFLGTAFGYVFTPVYGDWQGYFQGWLAALLMSILFIAMLLRRDSAQGQSLYIALGMLLGNIAAYVWVKNFPSPALYYPHSTPQPPSMAASINLMMMLLTGFFNVIYAVLIYRTLKRDGINPWRHF